MKLFDIFKKKKKKEENVEVKTKVVSDWTLTEFLMMYRWPGCRASLAFITLYVNSEEAEQPTSNFFGFHLYRDKYDEFHDELKSLMGIEPDNYVVEFFLHDGVFLTRDNQVLPVLTVSVIPKVEKEIDIIK